MKRIKQMLLAAMLAAVVVVLCACHKNPAQEQLYSKLINHFENHGFSCALQPLQEDRAAPIYKASAWQSLLVNGEEVLVYFDDSNRADYLMNFVDEETFGPAWRFGLRFVLVYGGNDAQLLNALNAIENVE